MNIRSDFNNKYAQNATELDFYNYFQDVIDYALLELHTPQEYINFIKYVALRFNAIKPFQSFMINYSLNILSRFQLQSYYKVQLLKILSNFKSPDLTNVVFACAESFEKISATDKKGTESKCLPYDCSHTIDAKDSCFTEVKDEIRTPQFIEDIQTTADQLIQTDNRIVIMEDDAFKMRDLFFTVEQEKERFYENKEESMAKNKDQLCDCIYALARLISHRSKLFEFYKNHFSLEMGTSGNEALELFFTCLKLAEDCERANAFQRAALEGIGYCLTRLSVDLSQVDFHKKEKIVAVIKSFRPDQLPDYQRFKSLLKYFGVAQKISSEVLDNLFRQLAKSKDSISSSERKDNVSPEQAFQNFVQSYIQHHFPDIKDAPQLSESQRGQHTVQYSMQFGKWIQVGLPIIQVVRWLGIPYLKDIGYLQYGGFFAAAVGAKAAFEKCRRRENQPGQKR